VLDVDDMSKASVYDALGWDLAEKTHIG